MKRIRRTDMHGKPYVELVPESPEDVAALMARTDLAVGQDERDAEAEFVGMDDDFED
jgi:hypothetical protein